MLCVIIVKMRFRGHLEESHDGDLHWLLLCVLLVRHGAEAVARWVTVPTLRSVRRVSSCWCPPPGSCILHYCHLSTSASSTQPHLARPGLKQPLIHLHPGGNMMTHTLPFFLRVSTKYVCKLYVNCRYYSLRFKPLDWNQTRTRKSLGQEYSNGEKLVDYWME